MKETDINRAIEMINQTPRATDENIYRIAITRTPADPDPAEVMETLNALPAREDYFRINLSLAKRSLNEATEMLRVRERAVAAKMREQERREVEDDRRRALDLMEQYREQAEVLRTIRDIFTKTTRKPRDADTIDSLVDQDAEVVRLRKIVREWKFGVDLLTDAVNVLSRVGMSAHGSKDMLETMERAVGWLSNHERYPQRTRR